MVVRARHGKHRPLLPRGGRLPLSRPHRTRRHDQQAPWAGGTHPHPHFLGAERVWFCCPLCGSRVRKLYLPPQGSNFGCRSCHSLSYASRQTRASGHSNKMTFRDKLALFGLLAEHSLPAETGLDLSFDPFLDDVLPGPAEEAATGPRPRGRPKEKRPYHRTTPFLTGKRPSERHGLCMRCRDYREPRDPQAVTLANGRSARKGTCPTCGATMILIVKG